MCGLAEKVVGTRGRSHRHRHRHGALMCCRRRMRRTCGTWALFLVALFLVRSSWRRPRCRRSRSMPPRSRRARAQFHKFCSGNSSRRCPFRRYRHLLSISFPDTEWVAGSVADDLGARRPRMAFRATERERWFLPAGCGRCAPEHMFAPEGCDHYVFLRPEHCRPQRSRQIDRREPSKSNCALSPSL